MQSSADRKEELRRIAPLKPRGLSARSRLDGRDVFFLCGTLGAEFDAWQRRLSAVSAADALLSQQIGLEEIEKLMDALEDGIGCAHGPRRSPGYPGLPVELSRRIAGELDAARKIGVSVTDAGLLVPSKSVTAVCEVSQ